MDETKTTILELGRTIADLGLSEGEAASRIGVTVASLKRHLGGAYVRSDSLAKYRSWLAAGSPEAVQRPIPLPAEVWFGPQPETSEVDPLRGPSRKPPVPHRVVDLFAGCGGLSLGFELADGGEVFRTVLAIDIEEAMVRVYNANHRSSTGAEVGRQADLTEFLNEAEVLAYYLEHLGRLEGDRELLSELDALGEVGLSGFLDVISQIDAVFVTALTRARLTEPYKSACSGVPRTSLSQTSVIGFHNAVRLPLPGLGNPRFHPPLWGNKSKGGASPVAGEKPPLDATLLATTRNAAEALWETEMDKLRDRAKGEGSGQLASASAKIREALTLLEGPAYAEVRSIWIEWRASREALRLWFFSAEEILADLRKIYRGERVVSVLLGGPPCQGFSRIGRGKIRSLREQKVHVQSDERTGDARNLLMHQYALFVAALAPSVFLFENVRHFQAEVKTPDGVFRATEVLAEAINRVSDDGLEFEVSSKIIVASRHLVPQNRERFFMVGIRRDLAERTGRPSPSDWCLALPDRSPVPLKAALAGLPKPVVTSRNPDRRGSTSDRVPVEELHIRGEGESYEYLEWIAQRGSNERKVRVPRLVDAHCARDSRPDDRAFFELLGPGKRWMDYRCDGNPLVQDLKSLVDWALSEEERGEEIAGLKPARLAEIASALDGSLSIRLLLDKIALPPGEVHHHLSSPNYLRKREGNHGDWLARLDAETASKTMVSHMGKDTYAFIHPTSPRTISVREAARVQTFPDWYDFGSVGLVDGYRIVGNAVPPLLSSQFAMRVAVLLELANAAKSAGQQVRQRRSPREPASPEHVQRS